MKVFISVLILIFGIQSLTKADDIRDFEIEGMSIGDSLLNFIKIEKIISNISKSKIYDGTNFKRMCINDYGSVYDRFCVTFLDNKKKIIQAIQGQIKYESFNYKLCKKDMLNIEKELSSLFKNLNYKNWGLLELQIHKLKYPDSTYHPITYDFKDGSRIQLACYNWPELDSTVFKLITKNSEYRELVQRKAIKK